MSHFKRMTPQIDAHVWVERDGKIIDPHFEHYDFCIRVNGCTTKTAYKEAPASIQEKAFKMFEEHFKLRFGEAWQDEIKRIYNKPIPDNCVQNSYAEVAKNGGRLVFGSMGWEKKKGGVWWEYGGEDWHTLNDFVKVKRCERCFNEEESGCPCGHARYCSKECQVADWKTHKLVCRVSKANKAKK